MTSFICRPARHLLHHRTPWLFFHRDHPLQRDVLRNGIRVTRKRDDDSESRERWYELFGSDDDDDDDWYQSFADADEQGRRGRPRS